MISQIFWKVADPLLRRPRNRRRLWAWTQQALLRLGVGSGAGAASSGERVVADLLAAGPPSGDRALCLFDVGANRGQYIKMLLAGLGGRTAAIHAFEPSQATFALLEQACRGQSNVHINPFGLGKGNETTTLYSDRDGSGLASLTRRNLEHLNIDFERSETVTIRTLDDYCRERAIETIDLLKIDVEGHELDVLHGGREMLSAGCVRLVQFEFGGCNIDTRTFVRDYWEYFCTVGMRGFFRILPTADLYAIDAYEESLEQFRTTNFLVVFDPQLMPTT